MSTTTVTAVDVSARRWILANALGLGAAFGLLALFGGVVEELGADHDAVIRDVALVVGLVAGGTVLAVLRQRALVPSVRRVRRTAVASSVGLVAGFVGGFVIAGPPLDFVLGILLAGTLTGAVEWRALREHVQRPDHLAGWGAARWLVAAVVAIVPAALLGDAIDAALGGGVAGFVGVAALLGLTGGAAGGALDARSLRKHLP
jgi:hypothetical protein